MSLNGIDSSKVVHAYQSTSRNDGEWLLLHYTSRDEVDLYLHDSDGPAGLRSALEDYDDKSPLYGLLNHGGKKALVKYVPEGTSRLLQARTSVHFAAIVEKFAPHDAVIGGTEPKDLAEAAVRDALGLPSDALNTIEDGDAALAEANMVAEEPQRQSEDQKSEATEKAGNMDTLEQKDREPDSLTIPRPSTAIKKQNSASGLQKELDLLDQELLDTNLETEQVNSRSNDVMGLKAFLAEVTPPSTLTAPKESREATLSSSRDANSSRNDFRFSESDDLPKTSYSSRPSTSDIWHSWKPKLKFGPRPVSNEGIQAPAADRQKLPAGVKMRMSRAARGERPKSRKQEKPPKLAESTSVGDKSPSRPSSRPSERVRVEKEDVPPMPILSSHLDTSTATDAKPSPNGVSSKATPGTPNGEKIARAPNGYAKGREGRRPAGLGIDSIAMSMPGSPAPKSAPALTPEKQRLMRALQMRRKHQYTPDIDAPALPTPSGFSQVDSSVSTSNPENPAKTDSGVDVGPPVPRGRVASPSPNALPRTPLSGGPNPLQSHPINGNMKPPQRPAQMRNSPTPSFNSNKELPKLPPEAELDQTISTKEDVTPASRPSSSKRKRSHSSEPHDRHDLHDHQSEAVASEGSDFFDELEAAQVEQAKPLPVPATLHNRDPSASSPTVTSVTIKSALTHQEKTPPSFQGDGLPSPGMPQFHTPVTTSLNRHPSNSSRPISSRPTLNSKRTNMSSGISRRIQTLAELSNKNGRESPHQQSAYESAQAFLAPGTLPNERRNAQRSTAFGRAYETSRSRSPSKYSSGTPRSMRPQTSFDQSRMSSIGPESTQSDTPTGYRKRDSLTVTAHIMRGHQQHMQHVNEMSINEEPGDTQDPLQALAGDRRPTTEPSRGVSPASPLPRGRASHVSFTRRSSGHSEASKRPASRSSAASGRARSSFDGWRAAFANATAGRRDSSSSSGHQRPSTFRTSTYNQNHGSKAHDFDSGLDRVDEVSEAGTRASRTSRMFKRMSYITGSSDDKQRTPRFRRDTSSAGPAEKELAGQRDRRKSSTAKGAGDNGKRTIVGDLNIQFPDELLWKRRWVEVDNAGNLVLSPPSSTPGAKAAGVSRKFHLTEFKQPVIPSRDRQEMPYSVVLDFVERGGALQLSAEDGRQQEALVKRLTDAHRNWLYKL